MVDERDLVGEREEEEENKDFIPKYNI